MVDKVYVACTLPNTLFTVGNQSEVINITQMNLKRLLRVNVLCLGYML